MRNDAVYIRKSSDPQEEESQIRGVREWLVKNHLQVPGDEFWFQDTGSRHHSKTRDDFQRMLALVTEERIGTVYCWKQDRIGTKNPREWFHILYLFEESGSKIVEVTTGIELTAPDTATEIQGYFTASNSQKFQQDLGDNVLRALTNNARNGIPQSKIPPYGYDKAYYDARGTLLWRVHFKDDGKPLVIMPDGTEIEREKPPRKNKGDRVKYVPSVAKDRLESIKYMFEVYATAAISPRSIAIKLNQMGRTRYGRGWSRTAVEYILSNPVYAGCVRYNNTSTAEFSRFTGSGIIRVVRPPKTLGGKIQQIRNHRDAVIITPGAHDPLVDRELFDLVQQRLATKKQRPAPPRREELYLRGVLYCGTCMRPMHCFSARGKAGYICSAYYRYSQHHAKEDATGCTRNWIPHDRAERIVLDRVGQLRDAGMSPAEEVSVLLPELKQLDLSRDIVLTIHQGVRAYADHLRQTFLEAQDKPGVALLEKLLATNGTIRDKQLCAAIDSFGGGPVFTVPFLRQYFRVYEEAKTRAARSRLSTLREEYAGWLLAKGRASTKRELDVSTENLARLDEELSRWEALTVPLDDQIAALRQKRDVYHQQVEAAQASISSASNLRKAELLRAVLSKVILHFRAVRKAKITDCVLDHVEFQSNQAASSTSSTTNCCGLRVRVPRGWCGSTWRGPRR
jgi:hypothetical protein